MMVEITALLLYHNDMKKRHESAGEWQALLAKKDDEIASLNRQVEWLAQQLRLMQGQRFGASSERTQVLSVSTPVRFCSFSPNRECRKMAGKCVQPLNNYTCRFCPSSLKQADKSGLDGLQAGK